MDFSGSATNTKMSPDPHEQNCAIGDVKDLVQHNSASDIDDESSRDVTSINDESALSSSCRRGQRRRGRPPCRRRGSRKLTACTQPIAISSASGNTKLDTASSSRGSEPPRRGCGRTRGQRGRPKIGVGIRVIFLFL